MALAYPPVLFQKCPFNIPHIMNLLKVFMVTTGTQECPVVLTAIQNG